MGVIVRMASSEMVSTVWVSFFISKSFAFSNCTTGTNPLHGKKRTGLNRPVDIRPEHACAGQREKA